MIIRELRSSFQISIVDSHETYGRDMEQLLSDEGYTISSFVSNENFLRQISVKPPHVLIYTLSKDLDPKQIMSDSDFVKQVLTQVPECHIIVLSDEATMDYGLAFYDKGVYDLIRLPMAGVEQLFQSIDRALQTDYYQYLNEQLKIEVSSHISKPDANQTSSLDLALLARWNQQLIRMSSYSEVIGHLCRELQTRTGHRVIYFKYLKSQATLVAAHCEGMSFDEVRGVGVNLLKDDKDFFRDQLHLPASLKGLKLMIKAVFHSEKYCAISLVAKENVLGTLVILEEEQKSSGDEMVKFIVSLVEERCASIDLQTKLRKIQTSDAATGTLERTIFFEELKKEISRSRRVSLPVTLSIFEFNFETTHNRILSDTEEELVLKNIAALLKNGCRSYDKVGRVGKQQFAVMLVHTSKKDGAIKSERLRREVESLVLTHSVPSLVSISASVGVSEYPSLSHDADAILNSADDALSIVLDGGVNRVCLASVGSAFVPDFIVDKNL